MKKKEKYTAEERRAIYEKMLELALAKSQFDAIFLCELLNKALDIDLNEKPPFEDFGEFGLISPKNWDGIDAFSWDSEIRHLDGDDYETAALGMDRFNYHGNKYRNWKITMIEFMIAMTHE